MAFDRRDDRLLAAHQVAHDAVHTLHAHAPAGRRDTAEAGDVTARAEVPALAGQHQHPAVGVGHGLLQLGFQRFAQGHRQRVAPRRVGQRQHRDGAVARAVNGAGVGGG
jgi:hypothetical protein